MAYIDDDGIIRVPCPTCDGPTELTPSFALTCQSHGATHYREDDGVAALKAAERQVRA